MLLGKVGSVWGWSPVKRKTAVCLLALAALPVFTNAAFSQSPDWPVAPWGSAGVHVAKTGSDSVDCGSPAASCLTITHALELVPENGTVFVHQGTYVENSIQMKSYTRLLSVDGPLMAKIYSQDQSAVRFTDNTTDMELDGFEIYADLNEPRSGSDRDGLVRVHDASNIVIRNCLIHDAPRDADVIKVSGTVENLLMDHLVMYNPAYRTKSEMYQEVVDVFGSDARVDGKRPVRNVILRNSWLFHTEPVGGDHLTGGGDYLIYAKRDVENTVYENNIFGPSHGGRIGDEDGEGPGVGMGTGAGNHNDPSDFVLIHGTVRNNIFVGCQGDGALQIGNADDVWVYNNTFYDTSGAKTRTIIQLNGTAVPMGRVHIFNNIFQDNFPTRKGGYFYWVRGDGTPSEFFHDYNLYYSNLTATTFPYTDEPNSVYDADPLLAAPAVPSVQNPTLSRIGEIRDAFRMPSNSPAVDIGIDAVGRPGHVNWLPGWADMRYDIAGSSRPKSDLWDLGAFEISGSTAAPAPPENLRVK